MLTNLQVLAAGFFMYDLLLPPGLNPIKNGPFRGHSRMEGWSGGGEKSPTSLKFVTRILQLCNLAQLYLT